MNKLIKNKSWWQKWRLIILGGSSFTLIHLLGMITDLFDSFQVIIYLFSKLSFLFSIPSWILFLCLLFFIVPLFSPISTKFKLSDNAKNILICLAVFSGILLGSKQYIADPTKKFIIVYDDEAGRPEIDLGNMESEFKKIDHLFQLYTTGQLNNAIFISTVSRPEIKWKNEFPNNTKLSSPIFSIQQVIEPDKMSNIIDISLSDFATEISSEIREFKNEIRIFYEEGFKDASDVLRRKLLRVNNSTVINTIEFNEKGFRSLLSNNVIIVFLGCSTTFKNSLYNLNEQQYNALIVPNWIRANIVAKHDKTNRICALSETYDKLMTNDFKTWKDVIDIIKEEDFKTPNFTQNIKTKIRSYFANNNQVFTIHF